MGHTRAIERERVVTFLNLAAARSRGKCSNRSSKQACLNGFKQNRQWQQLYFSKYKPIMCKVDDKVDYITHSK